MSTVKTTDEGLTSKSQKHFGSRFFKFHKQMNVTTSSQQQQIANLYSGEQRKAVQSNYLARRSRVKKGHAARDGRQQTLSSFQNAPHLDLHSQDEMSRPMTQAVNHRNDVPFQSNKIVSEYNSLQQRSLMSFKEGKGSRIQRMMSQATAGNNYSIKFKQAYRGISKKDII